MWEKIMVSDIFDCQSHQSCGEKKARSVFNSEWELFVTSMFMLFQMGELMEDPTHYELVEQDDQEHKHKY